MFYIMQNYIKCKTPCFKVSVIKIFHRILMQEICLRKSFKTNNKVILSTTNLHDMHISCEDKMLSGSSEFTERASGWVLEEILYLDLTSVIPC